jgi:heat shock protein HslJ
MPRPLIAPLLVLVLLAACGGGSVDMADPRGPEGEWALVDGVPMVTGYPITLRVEGGEVGGTAACNSYGGSVTVAGDRFEVGDLAVTEMGCPEPGVHESERAYLDALTAVERWAVEDGQLLVLTGSGPTLRFDPVPPEEDAPLAGTRWQLESLIHGSGPDGAVSSTMAEAWLELDDTGGFSAFDGCNELDGTWELDGDVLRARVRSTTDMACPGLPEELGQLGPLVEDPTVTVEGRSLTLMAGERGLQLRAAE